jgi:hypothetical protein
VINIHVFHLRDNGGWNHLHYNLQQQRMALGRNGDFSMRCDKNKLHRV